MTGEYSDVCSSYWAPGWNFERSVHADENDLATMPEDELIKIQDGLRDVLGDAGMSKLSRYVFYLEQEQEEKQENNKKRTLEGDVKGPTTSSSAEDTHTLTFSPPNWLRIWRKHFNGQQWGFVAFRAACYGGSEDDEQRWARFKTQVQRIVELPFERAIARAKEEGSIIHDDFNEARAKFTIQWEEEAPAKQDSTTVIPSSDSFRSEYTALKTSPDSGLSWDLFLCASPEAVESFEKEASNTNETSSLWRPRAPFLLAVAADRDAGLQPDHEESIWLKSVVKVAAEALVESLIDVVHMGTPLQRVTRNVRRANELDETTGHQVQEEPKKEADEFDEIWWLMHSSPELLRKKRRRMES